MTNEMPLASGRPPGDAAFCVIAVTPSETLSPFGPVIAITVLSPRTTFHPAGTPADADLSGVVYGFNVPVAAPVERLPTAA
jgi:hypothetical protein